MVINYNKLWKLLIDKEMNKTVLRQKLNMSTATLSKLSKNKTVSMDTLLNICQELDCNLTDIVDINKES